MKQLYRIRCKTETCAWWYMGGKRYTYLEAYKTGLELTCSGSLNAELSIEQIGNISTPFILEETDNREPLGFTASEIKEASETITQAIHRSNPYA